MNTLTVIFYTPIPPGETGEGSLLALVLYMTMALSISFLCSILEGVLLSSSPSHIELLVEQGKQSGLLMRKHKKDVDRPISAILTLNTFAHTMGAALAGAEAAAIFGNEYLGLISAVLTLFILIASEIIPKTLGAVYWKFLTPFSAYVIQAILFILWPAVWVLERLTRLMRPGQPAATVTRADLAALANISGQEGALLERETRMLHNLLRLNKIKVETIMTPRTVVAALQEDLTIQETIQNPDVFPYSRIPIYSENIDHIVAYVLRHDILRRSALDQHHVTLKELKKEIQTIPQSVTVADALNDFIVKHEHIFLVIDEFGGTAGIVTLEDAVESLLGIEITDESDIVADLRQLAQDRHTRQMEKETSPKL
jgi:CBS domain containing-hemolysin-like protein